jgi:hypothetical protein
MAVTTAFVNFCRTLGGVFGLAIAGTLFNNRLLSGLSTLNLTPEVIQQAANNVAFVNSLSGSEHDEIIQQYVDALQNCLTIMIPFGGCAFLSTLGIKHFALRKSIGDAKSPAPPADNAGNHTEKTSEPADISKIDKANGDLEKGEIKLSSNLSSSDEEA